MSFSIGSSGLLDGSDSISRASSSRSSSPAFLVFSPRSSCLAVAAPARAPPRPLGVAARLRGPLRRPRLLPPLRRRDLSAFADDLALVRWRGGLDVSLFALVFASRCDSCSGISRSSSLRGLSRPGRYPASRRFSRVRPAVSSEAPDKESAHESGHISRQARRPGGRGAGPEDRAAHRRDHPRHIHRNLRLGSASLRGARPVPRRRRHPRPRADGHRRGGRPRGHAHQAPATGS